MNIHLQVFVGYLSILFDKHLGFESSSHLGPATWSLIKSHWAVFSRCPSTLTPTLSAFQTPTVHQFRRLHPNRCEVHCLRAFNLHFPWSQKTGSIFSRAYWPRVSSSQVCSASVHFFPRAPCTLCRQTSFPLSYFLPGRGLTFRFCP